MLKVKYLKYLKFQPSLLYKITNQHERSLLYVVSGED